jgi:hypothetical protein
LNGYILLKRIKIMDCIDCGEPIPDKRAFLGYETCIKCSTEQKYVGRRQDKHGDVDIIRTNQEWFKNSLRRENKVGFNANLPVGNPATPDKEPKKEPEVVKEWWVK